MASILSCTDGSVYARSVYDHTAWAAQRMAAAVHVLHLVEPRRDPAALTDLSGAIGVDAQAKLTAELVVLDEARARVAQAHARAILTDAERHLTAAGLEFVMVEAIHGELTDAITRFEATADLVVIGKRGEHADFATLHVGGNLERVIRSCHHPVLVTSRGFAPIERVLVAFDGGPSSRAAIDFALTNPLLRGLSVHLLYVESSSSAILSSLETARSRLAASGFAVVADIVAGEVEQVIVETVKNESINLLVMGAYGHSRIRQFIVGSTTTTMVRTCHIPVLMFR
jgi:nucleotide-binding universal stress UspA family protein